MAKAKGAATVEHRYGALRFIAGFLQIIGYIVIGLGTLGAIGSLLVGIGNGEALVEIGAMLGSLLSTAILSLSIIASANSIKIIIDMEENTRQTAMMIEKLVRLQMRSMQ